MTLSPMKHPPETRPDEDIAAAVAQKVKDGRITCAAAHGVAEELNRSPREVGVTLDLLGYRIHRCQMGLFGYGPQKKIVVPADPVEAGLREAVETASVNRRLACRAAWDIAVRLSLSRLAVSAACETLGIKINACQLGAF